MSNVNHRGWSVQGVSGTVHKRTKQRITDHGYENFVILNHRNKLVRHSFLISSCYTRTSSSHCVIVWVGVVVKKKKKKTVVGD